MKDTPVFFSHLHVLWHLCGGIRLAGYVSLVPRPDPQCERPRLLRGHQLSRSLTIATGRTSQKENFHGPGSVGRSRSHLIRRGGRSLLSIAPAFAGLVGQARQRARFELLAVPRVSHHQVSTVLRCAEVYCFASTEARLQDGSRALLGTCRQ